MKKIFRTIWTGFLTLFIPVVLIAYVIKIAWPIVGKLSAPIARVIPFYSAFGELFDAIVNILIVVAASFLVGFIAQKTVLNKWTQKIEELIAKLFPSYSFYQNFIKPSTEKTVKGNEWKTILFFEDTVLKLGFLVEEMPNGTCVVFKPTVPNPYEGEILFKVKENLKVVDISFHEAVKLIRKYGMGLTNLEEVSDLDLKNLSEK